MTLPQTKATVVSRWGALTGLSFLIAIGVEGQHAGWVKRYGTAHAVARDTHPTSDGGCIAAGERVSNNAWDAWIVRLDAEGHVVWQRAYKNPHSSTSRLEGTRDGGCVALNFNFSIGEQRGPWILKLDAAGNSEWQKAYRVSNGEFGLSDIKQARDGGYIIVGGYSTGDFHGMAVLKLNSAGVVEWGRGFNESLQFAGACAVSQTPEGDYYVIGSNGIFALVVLKLNASGDLLWQYRYVVEHVGQTCSDITATADGGAVIASSMRLVDRNVAWIEPWIVKLNRDGAIEWQRSFGNAARRNALFDGVTQCTDGTFIAAGGSSDTELLIMHLDANGHALYARSYGYSIGSLASHRVKQTQDGGFIATAFDTPGDNYEFALLKMDRNLAAPGLCSANFGCPKNLVARNTDATTSPSTFTQKDFAPVESTLTLQVTETTDTEETICGAMAIGCIGLRPSLTIPGAFTFGFCFPTTLGDEYVIECKESLTTPAWLPLQRITGDGGLKSFVEDVTGALGRFFRVRAEDNRLRLKFPLAGDYSPERVTDKFRSHWRNQNCEDVGKTGNRLLHNGTDFRAANGDAVYAVADCAVKYAQPHDEAGGFIVLEHPAGYTITYTHVLPGNIGNMVTKGGQIGVVSSGIFDPHLHIQVRKQPYSPDALDVILVGRLPENDPCTRTNPSGRVIVDPPFPEFYIDPESVIWE